MSDCLSCPKCGKALVFENLKPVCISCGFKGNVHEGILDLRTGRHDYYFNPIPRKDMHEMTNSGSVEEWPGIIRRFMKGVNENSDWMDDLVVDGRYAWKILLDLSPDAVCLDLGCGLGNLVHNLSPHVKKYYAMDLTWERLLFSQKRFRHFNGDDDIILLAGGDGTFLPFADDSLDLVTLSGVLEWVPDISSLWEEEGDSKLNKAVKMITCFFGKKNPRYIQLQFLKEIKRVLKPQGQLFIGIENRTNYEYFTGRNDHHSGLLFGSLLPRFIANLYSVFKNRTPYRTYTYNHRGCRKLLNESGFPDVQVVGLVDGYTKLNRLYPYNIKELIDISEAESGLGQKIKANINFVPAHGLIAQQPKQNEFSFLGRLVAKIEDEASVKLNFHSFFVTEKDKGIIRGKLNIGECVLKLPFNKLSSKGEKQNREILLKLREDKELVSYLPKPLVTGSLQQLEYYLETEPKGKPLNQLVKKQTAVDWQRQAYDLWKKFALNGREEYGVWDDTTLDHFIIKPLQKIGKLAKRQDEINALSLAMVNSLKGLPVALGISHGKFSVSNLIADSGVLNGLVGWELCDESGVLPLDFISFSVSLNQIFYPASDVADEVLRLIQQDWLNEEEEGLMWSALEIGHVTKESWKWYCLLYWVLCTSTQIDEGLCYDNVLIGKYIDDFLGQVLELIPSDNGKSIKKEKKNV